jgi:transposase
VREGVRDYYPSFGRPSIDPVVFFKRYLVMVFEGIRSEHQVLLLAADRLDPEGAPALLPGLQPR